MAKTAEELQEKLQNFIDSKCEVADKYGDAKISTCSHSNSDQDIYRHRHSIIDVIRKRGYQVSTETNWGVIDITITKKIELK